MRSNHRTRWPAALAASAAVLALLLSGCGQQDAAPQASTQPTQGTSTRTPTNGADVDQEALLTANEQLASQLGDDYVQGWIEDGKLHVSTTSDAAVAAIEAAGAVGHLVDFDSAQLRDGISKIMAWQAKQPAGLRSAIHAYTLNPRTGGLSLAVDAAQREELERALAEDQPAGAIPLDFTDSSGPASPAPATLGTPAG